ncbi:carbohydrate esterase family 1 protein [Penicillium riverlandense]|uniref:carbohydrate esterase family 1 protein n=1 Tax=Penicillium riverlandense TaxID=1903569 RepID=UPI0025479857|nr:carbohydrate esterase family 1 protein [Penicillium riverlandense]KAJ5831903.1 carbohydrate esterase family 1 protein [Penicillium riverlandense]
MSVFHLFLLVSSAYLTSSAVMVNPSAQSPTGYEVTFTYVNEHARNVLMGGDIYSFTDQWHTTPQYNAGFDLHGYKPGDFLAPVDPNFGPGSKNPGYQMIKKEHGMWTYTTYFPSGTFTYNFMPDCDFAPNCSAAGQVVIDPDNPPIQNYPGQQNYSIFQVSFDSRHQSYAAFDLDFSYQLPITSKSLTGTLFFVNYTSPGSPVPAPNINDYAIYLPAEYGHIRGKKYPLFYLCHGGSGNSADWPNRARVQYILDRLIAEGHIPPTVVVMPSWNAYIGVSFVSIREDFMAYLFPHIEQTWEVTTGSDQRAFAGLSLGSALTYEMYINATSYFGYFGVMSGALLPGAPQSDYVNATMLKANPALGDRGIYVGFGLYDIAFPDTRQLQYAFDALHIPYVTRVVPWGAHYFNTWQDALWNFGRIVLWKKRPLTVEAGHGVA